MTEPAFEEFDPAGECDCAGCVHWRRAMPGAAGGASGAARHPAGARVVTVTAAAATAMTAAPVTAAAVAPATVAPPVDQGAPAVAPEGGSGGSAPEDAGAAEAAAEVVTGYGAAPGMTAAVGAPVTPDGEDGTAPAPAGDAAVDPLVPAFQGEAAQAGAAGAGGASGTVAGAGGTPQNPAQAQAQAPAPAPAAEVEAVGDGGAAGAGPEGTPGAADVQAEAPQVGAPRDGAEPAAVEGAEVAPQAPAAQGEVAQAGPPGDGGAVVEVADEETAPHAVTLQGEAPQAGDSAGGDAPAAGQGEAAPHPPVARDAAEGTAAGTGGGAPAAVVREEAAQVGPRDGSDGRPSGVGPGAVARAEGGSVRAVAAPRSGGVRVAPAREVRTAPARDRAAGLRPASRGEIIERARRWTEAGVPYDMERNWADGYRQDCSGFVSMAWDLPGNAWTGNLEDYAVRISPEELSPGDILLFHNSADPQTGSHVVIFGGWTDYTHTRYVAYEQTRPHAVRRVLDYPYPVHGDRYVPYRYRALAPGDGSGDGSGQEAAFPGRASFGPGATNAQVTRLGRMLVERGGARFYANGPGPRWGDADRRAVQAFQRAQGWVGKAADGLPGPHTWRLLVTGRGNDIPQAGTPSSHGVTGYPGRAAFRPGAKNAYVTQLGRQLVMKGYGRHYTDGPGPEWTDADRRAVQAFQRAQGWRGGAADGYPGPETWRRLFS